MTMESAGAPQTSFIETYNKNTYKDESYRSQSSDDDDADDNEFDSFDDSSHQLDAGGEQFGNGVNGNGNSGGNHGRCDETRQIQDLARRETNSMRAWRVMVLLLIMVTCATVTTGTFLFLRNGEKDAAEDNVSIYCGCLLLYVSAVTLGVGALGLSCARSRSEIRIYRSS